MDIMIVAHRVPYPADKGEKIRTFHQLKYLVEQGFQLTVFAPVERPQELEYASQLAKELSIKVITAPLPAAWWRKLKALCCNRAMSEMHFYSQALQQQLSIAVQASAPRAMLATSSAMAPYISKAVSQLGSAKRPLLLMDFMDLDSDKWRQYSVTASWPMRWVYRREAKLVAQLEQQIYRNFDHSFFISANEVELFGQQLSDTTKVSVLANGLDTQAFYPAEPKAADQVAAVPVFLFTGVMDYLPNEDAVLWFVEAMWPLIRQRYPQAKFYIAGMQPSKRIQQLEKQLGVIVTGYVDAILPYYQQADIFVGPFRLARGVQNKILQAMACGLPIVTTPLGAEGIACRAEQHLLLAATESEFVAAIFRLLEDQVLRLTLRQQAVALISDHYSWDGVLQPLSKLLNETGEAQ